MFKSIIVIACVLVHLNSAQDNGTIFQSVDLANNITAERVAPQANNFLRNVAGSKVFEVSIFARLNWFSAQQACAVQGLVLASINSVEEGEDLRSFLISEGLFTLNRAYWLAGTDLASSRNWVWFNTGRPLTYTNWARGEPNNQGGNEHCLSMRANGAWYDVNCYLGQYFVCEEP